MPLYKYPWTSRSSSLPLPLVMNHTTYVNTERAAFFGDQPGFLSCGGRKNSLPWHNISSCGETPWQAIRRRTEGHSHSSMHITVDAHQEQLWQHDHHRVDQPKIYHMAGILRSPSVPKRLFPLMSYRLGQYLSTYLENTTLLTTPHFTIGNCMNLTPLSNSITPSFSSTTV